VVGSLAQTRKGGEEGLVAGERAAEGAAVLIAPQRRRRQQRAPLLGVHLPIAHVLEDRTFVGVGARLRDDVDDAAREAAVLHVVAVGLDLELLDGVWIGQNIT